MIPIIHITSNHFVLHFQFSLLSLYFTTCLYPKIGINKNVERKKQTMNNESKELITIEELCKVLSIGRNTAYRLLNENKITAFRIGKIWKIPKMAVDEFILAQSQLKEN